MKVIDQAHGQNYSLYHADCIEALKGIPDNSIGLTITSPPFCNLYTYSNSPRDMGNTRDDPHFFENFRFLIPELLRVTIPGRLCVVHCKDLPLFLNSDGMAGLRDFPGELVKAFIGEDAYKIFAQLDALERLKLRIKTKAALKVIDTEVAALRDLFDRHKQGNWGFHSRITIWKDPKIERDRTNNSGLLHNQLCKDSSASRQGMADYLLVFRKWHPDMNGLNSTEPVTRFPEEKSPATRFDSYIGTEPPCFPSDSDPRQFSIVVWRKYASPVWFDIHQTNVLNVNIQRAKGEPHICPLQLDVIERAIALWTNPGDTVFDPFNGVGSTGFVAIGMDRKYIGTELKESYFRKSITFLDGIESAHQLEMVS
ncbi:MAG: DNA methyltransferase [Cyanobacteria bacterium P01_A01_bin.17]